MAWTSQSPRVRESVVVLITTPHPNRPATGALRGANAEASRGQVPETLDSAAPSKASAAAPRTALRGEWRAIVVGPHEIGATSHTSTGSKFRKVPPKLCPCRNARSAPCPWAYSSPESPSDPDQRAQMDRRRGPTDTGRGVESTHVEPTGSRWRTLSDPAKKNGWESR